jgi:threonine/homoserine/homoserine lactone efflux protein
MGLDLDLAYVFPCVLTVLSGRAGALLSRKRVRLVSRISGSGLIGGGIWLALTRAR